MAEEDDETVPAPDWYREITGNDRMPKPYDWEPVLSHTCRVLNEAADLQGGVASLIDFGSARSKSGQDHWNYIRSIPWHQDAFQFIEALRQRLATAPPATTGVYVGLDGLNMSKGGIEIGYNRTRKAGSTDIKWIYTCDDYGANFSTAALTRYYGWYYGDDRPEKVPHDEWLLVEYTVTLGFAGLLLRTALESLEPALTCHGQLKRAFAVGFHDGDMLGLGIATPGGFKRRAALGNLLPG